MSLSRSRKNFDKNKNYKVIGYDANSLYLDCTVTYMPTGCYNLCENQGEIRYSKESIQWLEYKMKEENVFIRHAENFPHGEKRMKTFMLDI